MKPFVIGPIYILCILFVSCIREVDLILEDVPDRIVLNASVTSRQELSASLSKTWTLMDSVPDATLPDATVRAYVNGQYFGTLQRNTVWRDSIKVEGQYILKGGYLREGDQLRLEAEVPGFDPVEAITEMPDYTEILSVDTTCFASYNYGYKNNQMRLGVRLKDNPGQRNYYRLVVDQINEYTKGDSLITRHSFHAYGYGYYEGYGYNYGYEYAYGGYAPLLDYADPVFQSGTGNLVMGKWDGRYCWGVFSDDLLNGREYTLKSVVTSVGNSFQDDTLSAVVHYDIHLLSVSESYFQYLKIMKGLSILIGDADFGKLIEPTDTYSNVTNGFGVVSGYQDAVYRITMPFGETKPSWTPFDPPYSPVGLSTHEVSPPW